MRTINGNSTGNNACVLCDSQYGEDSLEHLAVCRCTKQVFAKMGITITCMHDFLALGNGATNSRVMVNHLIALGLVYSIYNTVKHHDPSQPPLNVHALITAGISSALGAG